MSSSAAGANLKLVPSPWGLAACTAVGVALVLGLPVLARILPRGSEAWPNPTQAATTAVGILLVTVAYLYLAGASTGLSNAWFAYAAGYNGAIVVIKFILSPGSFHNASGIRLGQYVSIGFVVMLFYAVSLWVIWAVANRYRQPRSWTALSRLALLAGISLFAMGSRFLAGLAVGSGASDYLGRIFSGSGLILPALLLLTTALAIQAFDDAGHPAEPIMAQALLGSALGVGLSLIVVYHALWAIFMFRLFS
jgi:hypothetical protein